MRLSVIIPAYNEELYLPETLTRITKALAVAGWPSEIVVVDNDSHDRTRAISESFGARIVSEPEHNISRVRNIGAANATGDVLIFIDADTSVPESLFKRIAGSLEDEPSLKNSMDTTKPSLWARTSSFTGACQSLPNRTVVVCTSSKICRSPLPHGVSTK